MTTETAFARAALSHADALYNHARHLVRNDADAEELVQEAYLRAFRNARSFAGGSLKAWLFRILRNVHVDLYRRRQQQGGTHDELDGIAELAPPDLVRDDEELGRLRRLVGADIEAALGGVSEEARAIILLHAEGFTETEMADMLACPIGTIKSRLSRARALLRHKLKDYAR